MIKRISQAFILLAALTLIISCGGNEAETSADAAASDNGSASASATSGAGAAVAFTAYDIDGELHDASEWIGKKPVVINFWGTWCPPCRKEVPDLVKVYDEYESKGVEMLGIAVNDTPEKVRAFASANKMNWVMLLAEENIVKAFGGIRGVPTTIFLDKDGNEINRIVGGQSYNVFKQSFEAIL